MTADWYWILLGFYTTFILIVTVRIFDPPKRRRQVRRHSHTRTRGTGLRTTLITYLLMWQHCQTVAALQICSKANIGQRTDIKMSTGFEQLPPPGNPAEGHEQETWDIIAYRNLTDTGRVMLDYVAIQASLSKALQICTEPQQHTGSLVERTFERLSTVQSTCRVQRPKGTHAHDAPAIGIDPGMVPRVYLPIATSEPSGRNVLGGGEVAPDLSECKFRIDADVDVTDDEHGLVWPWNVNDRPQLISLDLHYHPDSFAALVEPTDVLQDKFTDIFIYTDGSAGSHNEIFASTWAFVVFEGPADATNPMMMRLIGWAADFNDLDPLSPTWMGAKQYEIRAGESEALIWSLLWTLQANDTRPIHIASDALVVLHAATGKWGYQPEDDIALRLRATYQLVWHNLGKDTLTNHIKGHSGQFGNELADTIAKSVRTGRMSPWKPCVNLAHWYHGSHPNILWAWLPFDSDHRPTSLPTYIDNAFCGTGLTPPSDDLEWLRIPHIAMNEANECWFQLRIASYNVSSIREAGRAAALREQAEFQGINVLGLQETRTELTDPCDSNYIRIIAGATSGVGGSELWLLRTQPFAWSQSAKYYFERHKAQVVHADSQLLLTTYHDGPLQLLFCVAHAPHSGQNHKVIENWWHQLATLIHRYLRHNHLILMIDANADPQLQSEGVGELQAIKRDKERPGDTCFGNFLAQFSLLLPATFAEWHEDRDVITWCSNDGRYQARNDFIAIPLTWRDFSLWSGPCAGLDSGTAGLDHTAVCIDVQGRCQLQKYTPMRPKFDRTAILHATDEDIEECFKDMPEVPWHTDVTTHAANIETFVEQRLAEHFPSAPTARKRSKVFSETTWYHMTMRNRFKKVLTLPPSSSQEFANWYLHWSLEEADNIEHTTLQSDRLCVEDEFNMETS